MEQQGCHSLEVLHPGVLPLEQPLELQVRLPLVEEDDLDVDVVPGRVEEVPEEGLHGLVVDVPADHHELAAVRGVLPGVPDGGQRGGGVTDIPTGLLNLQKRNKFMN